MDLHLPFLLLAFIASIVSSSLGFGAGIILVGFGSLFFDAKSSIFLANIFFLYLTLSKVIMFRKTIEWRIVLWLLVLGIPASMTGAYFMISTPDFWLKKFLGCVLVFYAGYKILHKNSLPTEKKDPSAIYLASAGGLWGFFGGLIGVGNPIKAMFLSNIGLTKEWFAGTMAGASLIATVAKVYMYSKGEYELQITWEMIVSLCAVGFVGLQIGRRILAKFSPKGFQTALTIFIGGIGVYLLVSDLF